MKKIVLILIFVHLLFAEQIYHSIDMKSSYKEGLSLAKEKEKDLVVFTYTDYCPWCDRMKKYTLEDFDVVNFIGNNFIFASVNRDEGDLPEKLVTKYVPMTFLVSFKDESIQKTVGGYKHPAEYIESLK